MQYIFEEKIFGQSNVHTGGQTTTTTTTQWNVEHFKIWKISPSQMRICVCVCLKYGLHILPYHRCFFLWLTYVLCCSTCGQQQQQQMIWLSGNYRYVFYSERASKQTNEWTNEQKYSILIDPIKQTNTVCNDDEFFQWMNTTNGQPKWNEMKWKKNQKSEMIRSETFSFSTIYSVVKSYPIHFISFLIFDDDDDDDGSNPMKRKKNIHLQQLNVGGNKFFFFNFS